MRLLDMVLFVLICFGHTAFWVALMSYVYGRPWHRTVLFAWRILTGVWILAVPLFLLLTGNWSMSKQLAGSSAWNPILIYEGLCLFWGAVVLPWQTLRLQFRPTPEAIRQQSSSVFDVAKEYGSKPTGPGRKGLIAQAPWNQLFQVEFTHLELCLHELPTAWRGLRILHLSDLHFHGTPTPEFFERVFDHCRGLGTPDLLLLTGDYVNAEHCYSWITTLLGPLQWKEAAYAVLGNHDWWVDAERVRRELAGLEIHVLGNGWHAREVRGETLVMVGNEGPWFRPAPDLSDCPPSYRIGLSHTPDNLNWARQHQIRLLLAGHNHGGQLRIPGFGSIFVPSRYGRRYDQGTFVAGSTVMHVNRGLSGKSVLRYFCRPQVTWITLETTKSE